MRKTDKKIEKLIVQGLTRVCEIAKDDVDGFEWLTHTVDYADFPKSLKVFCIFASDKCIKHAIDSGKNQFIFKLIRKELLLFDVSFKDVSGHIVFDTESGYDKRVNLK